MEKEALKKLALIAVFAAAMAFLEAVVVIYLRKIYYAEGFSFPLVGFIEPSILNIEWIRELGTIVMLITIALLAGKKFYERFAYFLFAFGVWDIFYYIWLKLALNWPSSIKEWDLLFLIPWPWAGPVLAPIIISFSLIALALAILYFNKNAKIKLLEWLIFISGCLIVLYTFLYDYGKLIISGGFAKDFFTLAQNPEFAKAISSYSPLEYHWALFAFGELLILLSIFIFFKRNFAGR